MQNLRLNNFDAIHVTTRSCIKEYFDHGIDLTFVEFVPLEMSDC